MEFVIFLSLTIMSSLIYLNPTIFLISSLIIISPSSGLTRTLVNVISPSPTFLVIGSFNMYIGVSLLIMLPFALSYLYNWFTNARATELHITVTSFFIFKPC